MSRKNSGKPRQRRQFSPEQKAAILRRHLVDKVPVSDLCDEYRIQPSLLYLWQNQVLESMGAVLQDGRTRRGEDQTLRRERQRIAVLEAKLAKKDAVIAEVSEEYLALKKKLGES